MRRSALAGLGQIILVNGTRFVKHQVYKALRANEAKEPISNTRNPQGNTASHSPLQSKIRHDLKNIPQLNKSLKKTDFHGLIRQISLIFHTMNFEELSMPSPYKLLNRFDLSGFVLKTRLNLADKFNIPSDFLPLSTHF